MTSETTISLQIAEGIKNHCAARAKVLKDPCRGCRYSIRYVVKNSGYQDCIFDNCPDSWCLK